MSVNTELMLTKFGCGCVWDWRLDRFSVGCLPHAKARPANCSCLNAGLDDGATTCWQHHNCNDGSCTHTE